MCYDSSKKFPSVGLAGAVLFLSANIYRRRALLIPNYGKRWVLSDIVRLRCKYFNPKYKEKIYSCHSALGFFRSPAAGVAGESEVVAAGSSRVCQSSVSGSLEFRGAVPPSGLGRVACLGCLPHLSALLASHVLSSVLLACGSLGGDTEWSPSPSPSVPLN